MEEKLFGFRGAIVPSSVVKNLTEEWEQHGISFNIKEGVFEVRFSSESDEERARDLANLFVNAWSFQQGTKLSVEFNHSWKPKSNGGSFHSLVIQDTVKFSDRLTIVNSVITTAKARIIKKSDSASFVANRSMVEKCLNDKNLKRALEFYSNEVVDDERPLYGIYKALEELTEKLKNKGMDGRDALAKLAGKNKKYVDEVMETTQHQRHAITVARKLLSEQECRSRAKVLLDSYAKAYEKEK